MGRSQSWWGTGLLRLALVGGLLLVVAGCGAAGGTATPGPTPLPTGAVTSRADLDRAVVRIESQGTFEDPVAGALRDVAGSGSGFIIDPSGLAVTNNHVVSGAGIVRVWLEGETEPRTARKVGLSECSDLALIDIDGEGFPYLLWRDGPPVAGMDVYAAGFPLGEPGMAWSKGIIAKTRANGRMPWASVTSAIEHTATIRPGNSGGPLVDEDGRVVAVNFATDPKAGRFFAIGRSEAEPVLSRLRKRENVAWLGVNGQAVARGQDESGVWVASVDSGSPADLAGVRPGDVITLLEGLRLARDGTMGEYCDILRGHFPEDALKLAVARSDEQLEGYVNGPKLAPSTSMARALPSQMPLEAVASVATGPVAASAEAVTATPEPYIRLVDDSGAAEIEVPAAWVRVSGAPWKDDTGTVVGAAIMASPDGAPVVGAEATAGVFFGASRELATHQDPATLLDRVRRADVFATEQCTFVNRQAYKDPLYVGVYDVFRACGPGDAGLVLVAAQPEDKAYIVLLMVRVASNADAETVDHVLDTFQVVGELP
jgi:serine protease Do